MTVQSSDHRPPQSSYASLRTPAEAAQQRPNGAGGAGQPVDTANLAEEARKLESLKEALFEAFLAAPSSGIPTALVDLAATYTSALRLQLTLMGYTASPNRSYRSLSPQLGRAKQL